MEIYRLNPTTKSYAGWNHSMYRGELIVRAENETDARSIAYQTMIIGGEVRTGQSTVYCPWTHPEFVTCSAATDTAFSKDGRREVLSPPEWDIEFPDSPKYCRKEL